MTIESRNDKRQRLRTLLRSCKRVAIACSGGVDSSLLLRIACDTLGPERVTALYAISCLVPAREQKQTNHLIRTETAMGCSCRAIGIFPLRWPEFIANTSQRCYFCKKRMYGILQSELRHGEVLMDGTNHDDLRADRPGLAAIAELSIQSPLAAAGLDKNDVRGLAREIGLSNWNQPSNSCLATRIPVHRKITATLLGQIEMTELFLRQQGIPACRVKPTDQTLTIQVPGKDRKHLETLAISTGFTDCLKALGLDSLPLDITIRDELSSAFF